MFSFAATTTALTPVRHEEVTICNAIILAAVTTDDRCYFSPRHVCGALGITWQGQLEKIKADPVLAKGVVKITTPSAGGSQRTLMLPIEFLSGWLFTIKKVRPEVQDKLNVFRAEGFVALDAWFRKGLRHSPTVADMLSNPDFAIELLTKFKEEQEARRRAEASAREVSEYNHKLSARVREKEEVIADLAPKAAKYEAVMDSTGTITITSAGKLLGMTGRQMGAALRDMGWLFKRTDAREPTADPA